jgi:predicted RNase H-like nuclease
MRPVDATLASALMKDFQCGAHAANTRNPCFGPAAGIWDLIEVLEARGYVHSPARVAAQAPGRYFFECYPHPALIGLFDLDEVARYKARHHDALEWKRLLDLLATLESGAPAVANVAAHFPASLAQTKENEDAVDAFVAAYAAALLYEHGFARSLMVGDLKTGYIVTPVSTKLRAALEARFDPAQRNQRGAAHAAGPAQTPAAAIERSDAATPFPGGAGPAPSGHSPPGAQTLCVNDPANIWGRVNSWMTRFNRDLLITFADADASPTVRFVPFANGGCTQRGLRISSDQADRAEWVELARGASNSSPIAYSVIAEYD